MSSNTKATEALSQFLEIMRKLRDPQGGCPWDLKQTFESLKPLLIEEAYEVADAVETGPEAIREELGDLVSLIGLFSQVAAEKDLFSFADVVTGISDKLVRRHPHIFGDTKVSGTDEVLRNWERIKEEERKASKGEAVQKGLLDGVPKSLPALLKAHQIGERCARVGFDWHSNEGVKDKIREELSEFLQEVESGESAERSDDANIRAFEEFGDLLFTLAQYGRHMGFNAEESLVSANRKFMERFRQVEKLAAGKSLSELSSEELEKLWGEAKVALNRGISAT
jgi:ATP diphosphatase